MQQIGIESSLVDAIRLGQKTVEGRLGKPRFLKIKEGDRLTVRADVWKDGALIDSMDDALHITITQVLYFGSFKEMLEAVGYKNAVPNATSLQDALDIYAEFYSSEDEKEYGVVALFFELLVR